MTISELQDIERRLRHFIIHNNDAPRLIREYLEAIPMAECELEIKTQRERIRELESQVQSLEADLDDRAEDLSSDLEEVEREKESLAERVAELEALFEGDNESAAGKAVQYHTELVELRPRVEKLEMALRKQAGMTADMETEVNRWKMMTSWLAACHATNLQTLPKTAPKALRRLLTAICTKFVLFYGGKWTPDRELPTPTTEVEKEVTRCHLMVEEHGLKGRKS